MANLRNLSRELRRARARIRWLEAENANIRSRLGLAPAPGALGVYCGAPPVGWINRNSAHPATETPNHQTVDPK